MPLQNIRNYACGDSNTDVAPFYYTHWHDAVFALEVNVEATSITAWEEGD